jgi:creatinine amidohydrolase/Fe(II)-dependent formamide hydrolase-like protein
MGVIGDAQAASAEFGKRIIDRAVEAAGAVLKRLLDHQRLAGRR